MAKVISEYTIFGLTFTAQDIYDRGKANPDDVGDKVVNGTTVEFTNITTARIGNVIGSTLRAVAALSTSSNVKEYSAFSPKDIDVVGTEFQFVNDPPYSMGEFAGYHHSAKRPSFTVTKSDGTVLNSGDTIYAEGCDEVPLGAESIGFDLSLGEYPYEQHAMGWDSFVIEMAASDQTDSISLSNSDFKKVGSDDVQTVSTQYHSISTQGWSDGTTKTFDIYLKFYDGTTPLFYLPTEAFHLDVTARIVSMVKQLIVDKYNNHNTEITINGSYNITNADYEITDVIIKYDANDDGNMVELGANTALDIYDAMNEQGDPQGEFALEKNMAYKQGGTNISGSFAAIPDCHDEVWVKVVPYDLP